MGHEVCRHGPVGDEGCSACEIARLSEALAEAERERDEALAHERQKEVERDNLLEYLHATTDEDGTHHRDWVADCQSAEADLTRCQAALAVAEQERDEAKAVIAEVHRRLDEAGVPTAARAACDDPDCNSQAGHRARVLAGKAKRCQAALAESGRTLACGHHHSLDNGYGGCVLCIFRDGYHSYERQVEALQAALRAVEWQPIETAPKDGTPVWLIEPGKALGLCVPHQVAGYWFGDTSYEAGGFWCEIARDYAVQATHWMPLPAALAGMPPVRSYCSACQGECVCGRQPSKARGVPPADVDEDDEPIYLSTYEAGQFDKRAAQPAGVPPLQDWTVLRCDKCGRQVGKARNSLLPKLSDVICPSCAAGVPPAKEQRCRQCRQLESSHCDLDEPGVDHPAGCMKMHHEFKPPKAPDCPRQVALGGEQEQRTIERMGLSENLTVLSPEGRKRAQEER